MDSIHGFTVKSAENQIDNSVNINGRKLVKLRQFAASKLNINQ